MKPGTRVIEVEKGVELFVVFTEHGRIHMAYRPGGTAAVSASRTDFRRFFKVCP